MKKLVIFLVVVCSLVSCSKDDMVYSCDKDADTWTKSNIVEIQQMTRTDWLAIGNYNKQMAAYNAFIPDQKQALWIGKMEEV
jgi:hypothetical protein